MDNIVKHGDVVRLVLGYLVNQNLNRAARTLCKTSPLLQQEDEARKLGLHTHNFLSGGLEEIIREHVLITGQVSKLMRKLPLETRLRIQPLKLSERLKELFKLTALADGTAQPSNDSSQQPKEPNMTSSTQRKRVRRYRRESTSQQTTDNGSKRPRLEPYFLCATGRYSADSQTGRQISELTSSASCSTSSEDMDSTRSSDSSVQAAASDNPISLQLGRPTNNSTPRTAANKPITPQTMPELSQAILHNEDFQKKLLNNINVALQTVSAPATVDSEALLDGIVRNILEATEKDPSFDQIVQEVVGSESPPNINNSAFNNTIRISTSLDQRPPGNNLVATIEPLPPQTPLIIRTAVAASAAAVGNNVADTSSSNIIQMNNSSMGTLLDPNFSISKLIVLNTQESTQKQSPSESANAAYANEQQLVQFGDALLTDAEGLTSQMCVDANSGQLTFPMYLSNDGMLTQLPFLVNNEWLAQQLRSDTNGAHIEIPLPDPITVTANQLPPNSIIINSAQKQQPSSPASAAASAPVLPTEATEPAAAEAEAATASVQPHPQQSRTASKPALDRRASLASTGNADSSVIMPASLDSSRMHIERVTPSTSGIVNVKAYRSMSTPRRRTSHVRTLNFSPNGKGPRTVRVQHFSTPVSTRREQLHKRLLPKQLPTSIEAKQAMEKPIIKNVEILSSLESAVAPAAPAAPAASTAASIDVSGNESHSSVPPYFATEDNSNQTVINAQDKAKSATDAAADMAPTPKRKTRRLTAVRACKRIISQSSPEQLDVQQPALDDSAEASKENQSTQPATPVAALKTELSDDLMAAWVRQRSGSQRDLETRLREINAKRQDTTKGNIRRKNRRKDMTSERAIKRNKAKLSVSTRKRQIAAEIAALEAAEAEELAAAAKKTKTAGKKGKVTSKAQRNGSTGQEFSIKIPTPQKTPKLMQKLPLLGAEAKPLTVVAPQQRPEPCAVLDGPSTSAAALQASCPIKQLDAELEKRTSNIGLLLDTPFKEPPLLIGNVPPTPGMMLMPLDTPYSKLLPSCSFLFGSDTKSINDTPLLSALTPGLHCTPFGLSQATPRSAAKTDYSSSSSYYRPDDVEINATDTQAAPAETQAEAVVMPLPDLKTACFGLAAERLPVEPTVLRRVHSFGSEAVDSVETAAQGGCLELPMDTHYKLVSGLPEQHKCSSSSSSSSASSSTSSSSASSAVSSASHASNEPHSKILLKADNLSDISSDEDEEWLKGGGETCKNAADAQLPGDIEPAQLVSQDGEVRYPLRNWLTPSKETAAVAANVAAAEPEPEPEPEPLPTASEAQSIVATPAATIKFTLPLKSADKMNQRRRELAELREQSKPNTHTNKQLAEVRERVMMKVKQHTALPGKTAAASTHKKLSAIRETGGKLPKVNPKTVQTKTTAKGDPAVLLALNLSAKKKPPAEKKNAAPVRKALVIAAQPGPAMRKQSAKLNAADIQDTAKAEEPTKKPRGRPRRVLKPEPVCISTRRSSRRTDNKTPGPPEEAAALAEPAAVAAAVTAATSEPATAKRRNSVDKNLNAKATKKPAKKRAEARIEQPAAGANEQQEALSDEYICSPFTSAQNEANAFRYIYRDDGPRVQPPAELSCLPANYFQFFKMNLLIENTMHTMNVQDRLQVLHERPPQALSTQPKSTVVLPPIRNIPKKRIIRFSSVALPTEEAATKAKDSIDSEAASRQSNATTTPSSTSPVATSTPMAAKSKPSNETDETDMEVAAINTTAKSDATSNDLDASEAGMQIEDIESILSHLHGT